MHTGQYYYDQMPLYYRRQFKKELKRQGRVVDRLNSNYSSHYWFIHAIPEWSDSEKGNSFWMMVAHQQYDQLDLNRPFARWFKDSHITQFINKHAVSLVTLFFLFAIISACVLFMSIEQQRQEKRLLKAKLKEADSINLINKVNEVQNQNRIKKALWLPDTSLINGALNEQQAERFMDSNPMEK